MKMCSVIGIFRGCCLQLDSVVAIDSCIIKIDIIVRMQYML